MSLSGEGMIRQSNVGMVAEAPYGSHEAAPSLGFMQWDERVQRGIPGSPISIKERSPFYAETFRMWT